MSELKKLQDEYQKKVKNLQQNCRHEEFSSWKHVEEYSNELYRTCLHCGFKQEDVAHKWTYVGKTPQGGLAGGDDVYECKRCRLVTDSPFEEERWAFKPCESKKSA